MAAITTSTITPQGPLASAPKQCVAEWNIGQSTVRLFRESDSNRLAFSDTRTDRITTFRSSLYDINYAVSLVSMFHNTVGVNLERETSNGACFLPKLCLTAHQASDVHAALFGHVDTRNHAAGEVKWLRWGVFNRVTKEEQTFEVDDDSLAKTFIQQAPNTNHSHLVPGIDKNGNAIMQPAADHYALTSYAKRFGVKLIRNEDDRIQKVVLCYVSLLDKNVALDENNWAVTLVSTMNSTQSFCNRLLEGKIGHAMLACEGVEHGRPFLRYVHFTQRPKDKNTVLAADEGRVETRESDIPWNTYNGPTWIRSKALVKNLFHYVQQLEKKPLKIALYGSFFSKLKFVLFNYKSISNASSPEEISNLYPENWTDEVPLNCFNLVREIAVTAGIIIQGSIIPDRPIKVVETVKSNPAFTIPAGFDCTCLGKSFYESNRELSKKLATAYVILIPEDSSPSECKKWAQQVRTERRIENGEWQAKKNNLISN